jgi:thiamine pyrophosphate-dependent acetolactate synthase large subunit-like protein
MGTSIPMAIGAAIASRQPVVCMVGDGGMGGYPAELRVGAAEHLPLCVVLVRDGAFSSVLAAPAAAGRSARPALVPDGPWWRAIEGLGIASRLIEDEAELDDALAQWDRRRPLFLDCAFPADWDRAPLEELR